MSIFKTKYGTHEDVLFIEFGSGDIMMARGTEVQAPFQNQLIFSQSEPHRIGEETDGYLGKNSDDIPDVKMVMKFNRPDSIAALIHSLIELQEEMFKGQNESVTAVATL